MGGVENERGRGRQRESETDGKVENKRDGERGRKSD